MEWWEQTREGKHYNGDEWWECHGWKEKLICEWYEILLFIYIQVLPQYLGQATVSPPMPDQDLWKHVETLHSVSNSAPKKVNFTVIILGVLKNTKQNGHWNQGSHRQRYVILDIWWVRTIDWRMMWCLKEWVGREGEEDQEQDGYRHSERHRRMSLINP